MNLFKGEGRAVLIGSLPLNDHEEAIQLVLGHTPEIPIWVQLPVFREEGMMRQFLHGFPGLRLEPETVCIDTSSPAYDEDILRFYQTYMEVQAGEISLADSGFGLAEDTARGFYVLMEKLATLSAPPVAIKGQVTGPITLATGTKDEAGRAIFYNEQLRDVTVKLLGLKAQWQISELARFECPVIIFIDEPALAGFGSSEMISISRDQILACLEEVTQAIHALGALAGVHICANTDWSLVLESSVDIVNFDAYAYFDKFFLYRDQIVRFIVSGRNIAWGIVPTLNADDLANETADSLFADLNSKLDKFEKAGLDRTQIIEHSLITPSCGAGSLRLDLAQKVLRMTREISDRIRKG